MILILSILLLLSVPAKAQQDSRLDFDAFLVALSQHVAANSDEEVDTCLSADDQLLFEEIDEETNVDEELLYSEMQNRIQQQRIERARRLLALKFSPLQLQQFYQLHLNPLDINTATEEQLLQLPFLTRMQALHILSYVSTYRPVRSLGELMTISRLDYHTRQLLNLFLTVGSAAKTPSSLARSIRHLQGECVLRTDIPFYTRKGFYKETENEQGNNPDLRM